MADDEDDNLLFISFDELYKSRKRRKVTPVVRPNLFTDLDEKEFVQRFRLSKHAVRHLLAEINEKLERNHCLTPLEQLLIALRFYATGSFQIVVGDLSTVSKATVCVTLHRVTKAIASLREKYVKFPDTDEQRRDVMKQFYKYSKLPGVIGAIDCTHIPVQSPGGNDAEIYRNRKGYFSVNVQLICDYTSYIMDVVARWPGSVHDSTIFDNSHIRGLLETSQQEGYLVGDGGYACRRYLLTPVTNPTSQPEQDFNSAHAAARNPIERANGILKRRFPALKYGMRLQKENVLNVIVAAVVLHNIALTLGEEEPPDDTALHSYIQQKRQERVPVEYDASVVVPAVSQLLRGSSGMRKAVIDRHFT